MLYNFIIRLFLCSILFCFQTVLTKKLPAPPCPKGWHNDESSRSCYYTAKKKMSQTEAYHYCHRIIEGAHLLRIECPSENQFLTGLPQSFPVWIDAHARFDIVDSSAGLFSPGFVFRWPNGKTVRYTNWAAGNGVSLVSRGQKCVQMGKKGEWQNADCGQQASVICEKKQPRLYEALCPKHWTHSNDTGSCYRALTRTNMTILDADNRCFQMGYEHNQDAMLASVTSEAENTLVFQLAKEKNANVDFVMLGGFGRSNNGEKWHWMDGNPFTYTNWDRGMPFGKKALALLVMNRRSKWINHYADRILSQYNSVAVCKFKL